ncbi:MAG: histidine kinase [Chthoniobacteraceae bacterium]|nr:histidine kinase [Chthoniobacteraceae bacterium]
MQIPRLNLNQRGFLLIAIPIVYLALLLGFLISEQTQHDKAQFWAVHSKEVLLQIERIYGALAASQSNLRGYVATGAPQFLTEYRSLSTTVPDMHNELARMVADNPLQPPRLKLALEQIEARRIWSDELIEMVGRGEREAALEQVRRLQGVSLSNAITEAFDPIRQAEESLDRYRLQYLNQTTTFQSRILIGGLILTLLIGFGVVRWFAQSITKRIAILSENVGRFSRAESIGEPIKGTDEIFDLDQQFRRMADNLVAAQLVEREQQERLERQNADLLRINQHLDQKNQENEMFVYSVSHDLRSPLVNLQGFSRELGAIRDEMKGLLAGDFTPSVKARAQLLAERDITEAIHFIQAAVSRLSSIIDALLRLSRVGRVEYRPCNVNLNSVVGRILEAMRLTITERKVTVSALSLPDIWGDPTAVEQVMANIIANAVNYSDKNRPGRIEIGEVASTGLPDDGMKVCYVKDNGLGIAKQHLPKVFTIFQRLHGTVAPGEGVGLALVERIVKRHGGKIWVESEEGVGTTFFIAFPIQSHSLFELDPKSA